MDNATSTLQRDCAAVQIPLGNSVTLPSGTPFDVTQRLGGNFTIHTSGGLFRIDAKDADALGMEAPASLMEITKPGGPAGPVDEKLVWDTLRSCFDPEIPVNIVDLGLVYDLVIEPGSGGNSKLRVKMTLTAPGCGMGTVIASDAREKLLCLPGVDEAEVEIVWDPPWHQSMISAEGRKVLGLD